MSSAEYWNKLRNIALTSQEYITSISINEYKLKIPNEKFLWNVWRQAETKNKILQERNFMFTECKTEMRTS